MIKYFDIQQRGVRSVYCGASYSLAIADTGQLYMFGQNKKTGEANMYPKPVQDLAGWNIQAIGAGFTSMIISADDTLIAWGASPTFGELVNHTFFYLINFKIYKKNIYRGWENFKSLRQHQKK